MSITESVRRSGRLCRRLGMAVLLLLLVTLTQIRPAGQSPQGTSRNTEALTFSEIGDVPTDRNVLSETLNETWYFIPSWSDTRSGVGSQGTSQATRGTAGQAGRYRQKSPFVVFDKRSRRWRSVAISRHAYEIYPVRRDPQDDSLIWFGGNDSRNAIIEWAGFRTTGAVDDPLIFAGHPSASQPPGVFGGPHAGARIRLGE
jgi:hypothetical protein